MLDIPATYKYHISMFTIGQMIRWVMFPVNYINIEVIIIKETKKAILVLFNGKKEWLPKSWILGYKHSPNRKTRIKVSESNLARKFM